jgi:hypothetical protein
MARGSSLIQQIDAGLFLNNPRRSAKSDLIRVPNLTFPALHDMGAKKHGARIKFDTADRRGFIFKQFSSIRKIRSDPRPDFDLPRFNRCKPRTDRPALRPGA